MPRRLLSACTAILFIVYFSACSLQTKNCSDQICFADGCIHIEIARTPQERAKGLQNRRHLSKDRGMLFIFPKSEKHHFWMKDTFIALDIVWIDESKRIVTIISNILPCETEQCPVYTPSKDALYVLEVNSGVTIELGLKVGDHAIF